MKTDLMETRRDCIVAPTCPGSNQFRDANNCYRCKPCDPGLVPNREMTACVNM